MIVMVVSVILLDMTWSDVNSAVGPLILLVASLTSVLSQLPVVSSMFASVGVLSLELYLLHRNLIHYIFPAVSDDPFIASLLAGIATLVLGYLLHRLGNCVLGWFNSAMESRSVTKSAE